MEFEPIQQERAVPSDSNLHANLHDPDSLTYEPSLGLREKAFSLSPDPRFFFRHSSHGQAFDVLVAGIRRREGILVITGEVGTGKSTLCRAVLKSLDPTTAAAFLPDPSLSREDLFKNLVTDFGIVAAEDIRTGRLRGASRFDLGSMLTEFVRSRQRAQAFAVVVIDEAQKLPAPILEEIRILCDLEDGEQVLRFILVGQPDLQSRLDTPEMRHITQRLTVRFELAPLAHAEVSEYISHRLTVAGNPDLEFTSPAIDLVWAVSRGIPRVINLVCDRALFRAAHAATRTIDFDQILAAVDDLNLHVDREVRVRSSDEHAWGLESFTPEARESQSAPHQWTSPSQPEPPAQPQSEHSAPSSGIAEPSGADRTVQRQPRSEFQLRAVFPPASGSTRRQRPCGFLYCLPREGRRRRQPLIRLKTRRKAGDRTWTQPGISGPGLDADVRRARSAIHSRATHARRVAFGRSRCLSG